MNRSLVSIALLAGLAAAATAHAQAYTGAFTYQGRLSESGSQPSGSYDMEFALYAATSGGSAIATLAVPGVAVSAGLFTARLNFDGAQFSGSDQPRYLEVHVRHAGISPYTVLLPRVEVGASPVSLGPWAANPVASNGGIIYNNSSRVAIGDLINPPDKLRVNTNAGETNAVHGISGGSAFNSAGVFGEGVGSNSPTGVLGVATATAGGAGVTGFGSQTGGYFESYATTGQAIGVYGVTNAPVATAAGVAGFSGQGYGVYGSSTSGVGVYGISTGFDAVLGQTSAPGHAGVSGSSNQSTGYGGYFNNTNATGGAGVYGTSAAGAGVDGHSSTASGVAGTSASAAGVSGTSTSGVGVQGSSTGNDAVLGQTTAAGHAGVSGGSTQSGGWGGYFSNSGGGTGLFAGVSGGGLTAGTAASFDVSGSGVGYIVRGTRNGDEKFSVDHLGDLSIVGAATKPGGGSWSASSDARLKKNIQTLGGSLDRLLSLRGVSFEYIDPEGIHELPGVRMGLVAQEVEAVFPDWVSTDAKGFKRVTVRGFEGLAVEAVRDLRTEKDRQVQMLQQETERLGSENRELLARVEHLEALLERGAMTNDASLATKGRP
jgi:hypothetical protein